MDARFIWLMIQRIVTDSKIRSLDGTYVVFDLETTGFMQKNNIIEIGAVKVVDGKITERFLNLSIRKNRFL